MFGKKSGLISISPNKINRCKAIIFLPFFLLSTFTHIFFIRQININTAKYVYKSSLKKANVTFFNVIERKAKTTHTRQNIIPLIKCSDCSFTHLAAVSTIVHGGLPETVTYRYCKNDPVFLRDLRI